MSHFTVLVIGNDAENQLAPFQENNMGDCPSEYLAFHDVEDESRKEYDEGTTERVVLTDGTLVTPHDERFKVGRGFDVSYVVPPELVRRHVPYKELYATFEEFVEEYQGYDARDEKTGRYGYWENPNAKWDWYQLGGRWTGFFKLKPGHEGHAGDPGLGTKNAKPGYADSCKLEDIDFDSMRAEALDAASKSYDEFEQARAGREVPEFATILAAHNGDHKAARNEYWNLPVMKDLSEAGLSYNIDDFRVTREQYLERATHRALSTFAVLKDGVWYERGKMGWWAMVPDEKDEGEWNAKVAEMLATLPPDTRVSVYDCHI